MIVLVDLKIFKCINKKTIIKFSVYNLWLEGIHVLSFEFLLNFKLYVISIWIFTPDVGEI